MEKKYERLFSLKRKSISAFISVVNKITTDQLDYQVLLGFLESGDSDVRGGAMSLLNKFTADQLENDDYSKEKERILNMF